MAGPKSFGEFLREERERYGREHGVKLTQGGLDRAVKFKGQRVQKLELGVNEPGVTTLSKLAGFFGWDMNEVMAFWDGPKPDGLKSVSSVVASRPDLRELFETVRRMSPPRVRQLTAVAVAWKRGEEKQQS